MASSSYQLTRHDVIKSLRWLTGQTVDEREALILTYCERLLVSRDFYWRQSLILASLANGHQTVRELMKVTGFSEKTVRRCLLRLQRQCRVEIRLGENRVKLYFVRDWTD